jgi:transposase InsO family protein
VRYAFIKEQLGCFPVRALCASMGVSRSGFYRWARQPVGLRERRREALARRIRAVHQRSRGAYGSVRVQRALAMEGRAPCRNTVAAVMRAHGLQGRARRRRVRTTVSRPSVAPDLLGRCFVAQQRDRVWTGDITHIKTGEGTLYLAAVMDLHSRRVVGWSMTDHMRQSLVMEALEMAVRRRRPGPGLIHHSDRGSQYGSLAFRRLLARHQIRQSMGRAGNCYDNAPTESLWSTIKRELGEDRRFATREEARAAVFEYIETFYNRRRFHSALGYKSPEEFEAQGSA